MAAQVPQKLVAVAWIQVASGLVNLVVMGMLVGVVVGTSAGLVGGLVGTIVAMLGCPLGCLGSFGWLCGLWGLALLPIGLFELACGAMALVNPDGADRFVKLGMAAELLSVVFGGIPSFVAGLVVRNLLQDPEVVAFLETGGEGAP